MLIESHIKPTSKPTRSVECFGKRYEFKELPRLPGRYIAEVDDERAQKALIATGAYSQFTDKVPESSLVAGQAFVAASQAGAAKLDAAAAQIAAAGKAAEAVAATTATTAIADPAAPATTQTVSDAGSAATAVETKPAADPGASSQDAAPADPAITEQAKVLLANSAQAIGKAVAPGPSAPPREVLAEALRIESAEKKPRERVVAALKNAIG